MGFLDYFRPRNNALTALNYSGPDIARRKLLRSIKILIDKLADNNIRINLSKYRVLKHNSSMKDLSNAYQELRKKCIENHIAINPEITSDPTIQENSNPNNANTSKVPQDVMVRTQSQAGSGASGSDAATNTSTSNPPSHFIQALNTVLTDNGSPEINQDSRNYLCSLNKELAKLISHIDSFADLSKIKDGIKSKFFGEMPTIVKGFNYLSEFSKNMLQLFKDGLDKSRVIDLTKTILHAFLKNESQINFKLEKKFHETTKNAINSLSRAVGAMKLYDAKLMEVIFKAFSYVFNYMTLRLDIEETKKNLSCKIVLNPDRC